MEENLSLNYRMYPSHVKELIQAALGAANPFNAVAANLGRVERKLTVATESYELGKGQVILVSVGKAAVPMGLAATDILGDTLSKAIFVTKKLTAEWQTEIEQLIQTQESIPFELIVAGHPVPNEESVRAGTAVLDLLADSAAGDLVLFLISGGASALLAQPQIPLADWGRLTDLMLASGCTINELNCVRRQFDKVKGGGLAYAAAPAACISLILSDVVGNPLEAIGSGPTVILEENPDDALAVLERYHIADQLKKDAWQRLIEVLENSQESPILKPSRNQHFIIADVQQAADAAMIRAAQLGFIAEVLTAHLEGEAREIGRMAAAIAKDLPAGHCLILGGETTVTLSGQGKGGRNQELSLSAAIALEGWPNRVLISFATDGEDGPTDAAGAVVTGETAVIARHLQLNPISYLDDNDSYNFFQELSQLSAEDSSLHHIHTGSTGTNVNDLLLILTYPDNSENMTL